MERKSWRSWFQFRLSSLLWLSIIVSITATLSYRWGVRAGIDEQLARQRQDKVYLVVYQVQDLVISPGMAKPDFDSLIDLIQNINPRKWDVLGGPGSVAGFDTNGTLVVSQDADTHSQIESKLASLRQLRNPTWMSRFLAWVNDP